MTSRREARRIYIIYMSIAVALWLGIIIAATYFTLNPPPPIKFVPPAIWSELHVDDGDVPIPEFDI